MQGTGDRTNRSGKSRSVGDILPVVGRAAFRRFGFMQSAVVSRWPEIVGDRYAEVSAPDSIRFPTGKRGEGTLTLTVEGAFAPMLQHVSDEIVERVNRFFGYRAVSRLVLRHGVVGARRRRPVESAAKQAAPLPGDMTTSLKAIEDDGLRACLEALAVRLCETSGPPVFDNGAKSLQPVSGKPPAGHEGGRR